MAMMKVMLMVVMMMVLVGTIIGEESHADCLERCQHLCADKPLDKNCVRQCVFFNCGPPSLPTNVHHSKYKYSYYTFFSYTFGYRCIFNRM
ncbi:unnamed protein product [Arabidopsis lyrata]|uniref:Plant thionin family protein n=1 Tax=Arabidopsis lyrata subsp. lyrata TaxID=81972 RepID=D7LRK2_ARALL|nr:uncharacterized protein LOC9311953 [Arabidopsis lyrata subsp. lyrata]EFH52144.1 hypothetical protein ARALYDRAFT_906062 [Arabidopsis lyrata subsp. lyrata]CAH8267855.1 unnamed protein product [Arabidopsis lyrata]|eukprot:XP_020880380.1 uncharacterized protein LOC9311953 [Arabidopsis lyrata subsp. lyrata]